MVHLDEKSSLNICWDFTLLPKLKFSASIHLEVVQSSVKKCQDFRLRTELRLMHMTCDV